MMLLRVFCHHEVSYWVCVLLEGVDNTVYGVEWYSAGVDLLFSCA